jgi:Spy/CpxP family protein refolding chaperone
MKRILRYFVLSLLLLFIASQLSYAEPFSSMDKAEKGFREGGPSPMMPSMPCPMEQMKGMHGFRHPFLMEMENLKLDEKQKDALREIENSVSKELIRKRADEQIAGIELGELLDSQTVDLKAVEAKLKQIADIKTETQLIVIKSVENIKAKLTPQQRQMLKKLRPMKHQMRPAMMGKGMRDDENMLPPSMEEREE